MRIGLIIVGHQKGSSEMHTQLKEHLLRQIDDTLAYQKVMRGKGQHDDLSGLPHWEYERFITMALAAIQRVTGTDSVYMQQATDLSKPKDDHLDYYSSF